MAGNTASEGGGMSSDLEQAMREALDGKFYSFTHNDAGGMKIHEKSVPKDYCPPYNITKQPLESASRGGRNRHANEYMRIYLFWTDAKTEELKRLHATGDSARKIGLVLGISRFLVGKKCNELGLLNRYGDKYHDD